MNVAEKANTMEKSVKTSNKKKSKNKKIQQQSQEKLQLSKSNLTQNNIAVECKNNKVNDSILNGDSENLINDKLNVDSHTNGCIENILPPKNENIKCNVEITNGRRSISSSSSSSEQKDHELEENGKSHTSLISLSRQSSSEKQSENNKQGCKPSSKKYEKNNCNFENCKTISNRSLKKQKKSKIKNLTKNNNDNGLANNEEIINNSKNNDNLSESYSVSISPIKTSVQNDILEQSSNHIKNYKNYSENLESNIDKFEKSSSSSPSSSKTYNGNEKNILDQKLDTLKEGNNNYNKDNIKISNNIETNSKFNNDISNKCSSNSDSSSCNTSSSSSCKNENTDLPKEIELEPQPTTSKLTSSLETSETDVNSSDSFNRSNIVIEYKEYESELQMQDIMRLIQSELSEPYSIYTYRYFIYNWPKLCFLAAHGNEYVGAIVCKLDMHMNVKRGYIAMLAVKKEYRNLGIGTNLVQKAIEAMLADNADEVVLETEMENIPALRLYENLGFVRDKRLFRYYLSGVDALRLKLWFR